VAPTIPTRHVHSRTYAMRVSAACVCVNRYRRLRSRGEFRHAVDPDRDLYLHGFEDAIGPVDGDAVIFVALIARDHGNCRQ